jgi:hypothetical protein
MRALMDRADGLDPEALRHLQVGDLPLSECILNSARWFLCVSDLDRFPESKLVLRAFAKSALVVAEAVPALLDRVRPDVVFMLNGLFFAERILRAEAARRGIRVVTYERGYVPNTLCFSNGFANYYEITPLWDRVKDLPLSPDEAKRLDEYLADRRKGLRAPFNYWPTITEDEQQVLQTLSLDPAKPTAVLFTNIPFDTAAQDRDRGFQNMHAWIAKTVQVFAARPEAQLVIRVHPAEVRVPGWVNREPVLGRLQESFPTLPVNVRIVPPESDLSSYTLAQLARCGLVYSSTMGLEMAMEGIPVVVAGEVHYGDKGFTLDTAGPTDYPQLIVRAMESPRDRGTQERARRYGYALFFRYFHQFPLVSENPPDFVPKVIATDPSVLDPGGDPTLDVVCRGVLEHGEFFVPA